MRFEQQISGLDCASCGRRRAGPACSLPAVRCPLSDRLSAARPPTPTPAQARRIGGRPGPRGSRSPSTRPCGWRSRTTSASRPSSLSPQIQALGVAQRAPRYAPALFSNTDEAQQQQRRRPTSSAGNGCHRPTRAFRTNAGVQQNAAMGRRPATRVASTARGATTERPRPIRSTRSSARASTSTSRQPLLRNFTIDAHASDSLLLGQKQPEIVPTSQLQQRSRRRRARVAERVLRPGRSAIAGCEVAQQSLDLRERVAEEQRDAGRSRDDGADRHRRRPKRKSRATRRT